MNIVQQLEDKRRFRKFLKERFFLRFHMFLILTAAVFSGLLATKILLSLHVNKMLIRYPVAIIVSYLAFFGFIKLWLWYLSSTRTGNRSIGKMADGSIDIPDVSAAGHSLSPETFSGGGGHFGGGGATGSFSDGQAVVYDSPDAVISGHGESVGDGIGDAVSGIFEDAGIILVILGLLIVLISGAGIYLIYEAPVILSEAAFEFLLATSLIRGIKRMDNPDWIGSVLRTTFPPFMFVFFIAIIFALTAQAAYPQAAKLSEVVKHLLLK